MSLAPASGDGFWLSVSADRFRAVPEQMRGGVNRVLSELRSHCGGSIVSSALLLFFFLYLFRFLNGYNT